MNEKSSRSHTVFQILIEKIEKNVQTTRTTITSSEINLVDLAGSEGAGKMHALNCARMTEGVNINKSLLALSNVINKLGNSSKSSNDHINFRDSKLTRILQNSLQGNS